jgi:hypothetical protein
MIVAAGNVIVNAQAMPRSAPLALSRPGGLLLHTVTPA